MSQFQDSEEPPTFYKWVVGKAFGHSQLTIENKTDFDVEFIVSFMEENPSYESVKVAAVVPNIVEGRLETVVNSNKRLLEHTETRLIQKGCKGTFVVRFKYCTVTALSDHFTGGWKGRYARSGSTLRFLNRHIKAPIPLSCRTRAQKRRCEEGLSDSGMPQLITSQNSSDSDDILEYYRNKPEVRKFKAIKSPGCQVHSSLEEF